MTKAKSNAWYAIRYAKIHEMKLIPLLPMSKRPASDYWNMTIEERPDTTKGGKPSRGPGLLVDPDKAVQYFRQNPNVNIGLELGRSGFCSLDIDDLEYFEIAMRDFGLDEELEELYRAPTIQGSSEGKRILFRVPEGSKIGYGKLVWPHKEDPDGSKFRQLIRNANEAKKAGDADREKDLRAQAQAINAVTVFELRAAADDPSAGRNDVLPPSIHPETKQPYRWLVQPSRERDEWPEPPAWLLTIWEEWGERFEKQFKFGCPWLVQSKPQSAPSRPVQQAPAADESVIDRHLREVGIEEALREYGYVQKGARWLSPFSSTGLPGVTVEHENNRCFIFHASDPLSDRPVNAFDLYCHFEHNGNASDAVRALSERYGMRANKRELPPSIADAPPEYMNAPLPDPPVAQAAPAPPPAAPSEEDEDEESSIYDDLPFRALGFDDGNYFYLPRNTEQVTQIVASSHTSHGPMLRLADLSWWTASFPRTVTKDGEHKGVDWTSAAAFCMQLCHREGVYDETNIRGRGAWFDSGRAILHLGNRILVDGKQHRIADVDGDYIYTRMAPMEGENVTPATDEEARKVANLFTRLHWSDKAISGQLLAGWCALAPICGALQWRPHIWVTAQRGAGKTWVQDRFVNPLLGRTAITTLSGTTEAGLRQDLRWDARPVIYDEAESERNKTKSIMQGVLELARVSSSESTARILKGTASGRGTNYMIRSMFYLSSINVQQMQAADTSRVTVVRLNKPPDTKEEVDRFADLERDVNMTLTREMCAKIRARSYELIPVIRANAQLLGAAIAKLGHGQRAGDQYGALVAGAVSLYRSTVISEEEADEWAKSIPFDTIGQLDQPSDEDSCIAAIMQHHIVYDGPSRAERATIGELVEACDPDRTDTTVNQITPASAKKILGRYGVRVDDDMVAIANNHKELARILSGTPWANGWKHVLERMNGASTTGALRFSGSVSRAVQIPITEIIMQGD